MRISNTIMSMVCVCILRGLIKMFFTASHLFSVLKMQQFGEVSEEVYSYHCMHVYGTVQ